MVGNGPRRSQQSSNSSLTMPWGSFLPRSDLWVQDLNFKLEGFGSSSWGGSVQERTLYMKRCISTVATSTGFTLLLHLFGGWTQGTDGCFGGCTAQSQPSSILKALVMLQLPTLTEQLVCSTTYPLTRANPLLIYYPFSPPKWKCAEGRDSSLFIAVSAASI